MLPPDGHVHSEWSGDAFSGSMDETCARAVELRLPWLAFTEHVDFTPWALAGDEEVPDGLAPFVAGACVEDDNAVVLWARFS